jgi:hypothetical protein
MWDIAALGGEISLPWIRGRNIDLLIMNVEGAEFVLLPRLIEAGVEHIRDLQIQFHDIDDTAYDQMTWIQDELRESHYLTYQYPFCMENWRRL